MQPEFWHDRWDRNQIGFHLQQVNPYLPRLWPTLGCEQGGRVLVPAGVAVQPRRAGVAGFVYSRSGLGAKQGLTVAQGVGVIDPDYTGEIFVMLLNTSGKEKTLRRGERMAQLVFQPFFRSVCTEASALEHTERGDGGFGHTGRQ